MPVPDPRIYLLHILDCCERLSECAILRDEGAVPARILLDAVCRNLEVIGEASRFGRSVVCSQRWQDLSNGGR